jgi:hypothetical protein
VHAPSGEYGGGRYSEPEEGTGQQGCTPLQEDQTRDEKTHKIQKKVLNFKALFEKYTQHISFDKSSIFVHYISAVSISCGSGKFLIIGSRSHVFIDF